MTSLLSLMNQLLCHILL